MDTKQRYEFDSSQNETIRALAKSLQFIASVTLIFAVVFGAGSVWAMTQGEWPEAIMR